ncbi:MAG: hypothetical protein ABW223_13055 [Rariglobus sp.]
MRAVTDPNSSSDNAGFGVGFGEAASGTLHLPIPVLGGEALEDIFGNVSELPSREGFRLWQRDGLLIGAIDEPATADLSAQAHDLYGRLLGLARGRRLARVWNYVPRINEPDASGLENYRAFCRGRSLAFEAEIGSGYREHLPAASAVGGVDGRLSVIFVATDAEPVHVENVEQVPAYEYPPEHGPRPPSFARVTRVAAAGQRYVFVSGTAAIKGHATQAEGDFAGQIACTLDNLSIVSRACDLGEDLAKNDPRWARHFKVYLRHAADYAAAAKLLDGRCFAPTDRVTWLLSDICRAALLIEIEATLVNES